MSLGGVLEEMRMRLEEKIKQQLSGLQGFVVRPVFNSMMPLRVEMLLAPDVFEFEFLKDGIVELSHGRGSNVDVRIESDAQTFMNLFKNPSAELFKELERQRKIRVTPLTKKGNNAETYIRKYLAE
jgi:hypothetical protein